jgi:hypothetical protein
MKRFFSWLRQQFTRRRMAFLAVVSVFFALLAVGGIQAWEWSNSPEFCADMCHDVHPEEAPAYQDSYHAQVKCVECHMGRLGTLRNVVLKASHAVHLPAVLFDNWERPLIARTTRPANESCEKCHWPESFHDDTVREIKHFATDAENSETSTYLIMHVGGGTAREGRGKGIHWHIENEVEYIATDEQKTDIPWVRVTFQDGRTVVYQDVMHELTEAQIADAEKHTMDCVACHNRIGHPFPYPERALDEALTLNRIDRELPEVKAKAMELFDAEYDSPEEGFAAIEEMREVYVESYPDVAAAEPESIDQAEQTVKEIMERFLFEEEDLSWRSFPDHDGHKVFSGCFRCHDGKHLDESGNSIRLHCNICHSLPVTVAPTDEAVVMEVANIEEPKSHLEPTFMADHRFLANDVCTECHGPNTFGADNSTFCANSACHGQAWPEVDLNAAFPHPIALEGKHAEVWCHNCHNGVKQPAYECANCHQPSMEPHFGEVCEDCHTTGGFELADASGFEHVVALEGAHADLTCSACHTAGQSLTYECATCHQPPSEPHFGQACEDCHTPVGFKDATLPPELHPVPLIGAHLYATCDVCHAEGQRVPEYVCSNCHQPPKNHLEGTCDTCHTPEGWVESAASFVALSPHIPHALDGLEDCLFCHDPTKDMKPVPEGHEGFANEQCTLCHTAMP